MNTIESALHLHKHLSETDSARLDCELLLCRVLEKERAFLYTWPEKELSDGEWNRYLALFDRRKQGEPIAHILGEKEFWSLSLLVDPSTLIPRPETELLVELVLENVQDSDNIHVADLGTGTGAVVLALAKEKPNWTLIGVEKNPAALKLAKENQKRLNINNVQLYLSDWFEVLDKQCFDIIVSNPPYIDKADHHLKEGDVKFEPLSALVADDKGLADIQHIIESAPLYLKHLAYLLIEHGHQQGHQVRALFAHFGFSEVETKCDLAGNERVTFGRWVEA